MAITLGGAGGGGGGLYGGVITEIPLTRSQTFVPPRNGTVNIICIGAGGSGSYCWQAGGTIATGGGAGGLCIKEGLDVTTSSSFTVTIGAGGAGVASNSRVNGNAGGNTTVSGTGLSSTLTANGGGGGQKEFVTENGAAGGTGGTASNGDFNRTGGAGGSVGAGIVTSGNRSYLNLSTGGGAVAILTSTGYAGGSFTLASGGTQITNDHYLSSGGAGIGGRGGGVHAWSGNLGQNLTGYNGGGSNYAGYDKIDQHDWIPGGTTASGRAEAFAFPYVGASLIGQRTALGGSGNHGSNYPLNGGGIMQMRNNGDGNYFTFEGHTFPMGAGGGGYSGSSSAIRAGYGGAFAGGGGTTHYHSSDLRYARSGDGGAGGGGGGFVSFASSAQYGTSGYGGPGMVFIHYTAYA